MKIDTLLKTVVEREGCLFIDTCSLMHPGIHNFTEMVAPLLKASKKKIIVPKVVVGELIKHSSNPNLKEEVERATETLHDLKEQDLILVVGDEEEPGFGDIVFLYNVLKKSCIRASPANFRLSQIACITVFTHDKNLSHDLMLLNDMKSINHHRIETYKFSMDGRLLGNDHN